MSSKIKVDNITDQGGNELVKRCGSTTTIGSGAGNTINVCGSSITLGRSGGTVSLASGASQSGFGRAGSVDWQTTIKTGDFTAVSGEGYFVNTTSGPITMTLPSSPSVGDIVAIKDYANTFDSNALTIGRNGQPISGDSIDPTISTEGQALTLVYGDSTKGWQSVAASTESDLPKETFIVATGGTITNTPTCRIHTFTGPGTFTVCSVASTPANNLVAYLVVAGGGAGGGSPSGEGGGGGGAGGFREVKSPVTPYSASPLDGYPSAPNRITVTAQGYPITVGGGAAIGSNNAGNPSTFSSITSAGGGSGGQSHNDAGNNGGSGGGGTGRSGANAGTGNTPPTSPSQGNPGSSATPSPVNPDRGGGGGGATASGGPVGTNAGNGGAGATTSISNAPTAYAGGGGGAKDADTPNGGTAGDGGVGGGGNGASSCASPRPSTAGGTNTGGGGGGQAHNSLQAGAGGSGIVIIRYKIA